MSFVNPTRTPDDWHPRAPRPSDTCPGGLHCTSGGRTTCAYDRQQCAEPLARGWWAIKGMHGTTEVRCSRCGEMFYDSDKLKAHAQVSHNG